MRNELHVGRGTTRGALTVFPVWNGYTGPRGYDVAGPSLEVGEAGQGPSVPVLAATNPGARPALMVEGALLEGGWQSRMLVKSVLVPARGSLELPVACVEQGRWGGAVRHEYRARRVSERVKAANRSEGNVQGEVWRRVAEYDARFGSDSTQSFVGHVDRSEAAARQLVRGLRRLHGQAGIVVAIAGQPVALEVFDSPRTFAREFDAILQVAAMDALGLPAVPTPGRRARRFVECVEKVRLAGSDPAGVGRSLAGRTEYADLKALGWQDRLVHLTAVNPRHELVAA